MTYDSVRRRVVMYGGQDQRGNIGTTPYEWDGTAWTRRATTQDPVHRFPPPVIPSPLAFDRHRNVYVLYRYWDTWELDGSGQWMRRAAHPDGIAFASQASMAFDSDRGSVLLHGITNPSPTTVESSLWDWSGSAWRRKPALLPLSENLAMGYDSVRGRTVLVGGGVSFLELSDVFEWRYFADDPTCSRGPP